MSSEIDGNKWKYMEIDGNSWKYMKIDGTIFKLNKLMERVRNRWK